MTAPSLNERIEQFFGSRPRDGSENGVFWWRRTKIETRLSQLLLARSQNICIDGPTGSGKSSLAITVLSRIRQPYIWVPLVNHMEWPDFCEDIIIRALQSEPELSRSYSYVVGVDAHKPVTGDEILNPLKMLGRVSIDRGKGQSQSAAREAARKWTISDVENFLEARGLCLLVDDFEKANEALVQAVADLCKRLTMRSLPKCTIIGTGKTFARLYHADEGLDGRLAEISVASFGTKREIWNYINEGLELLGFDTPRAMLRSKLISKQEADAIERAFYEAADGMPKYINELALRICERILNEENAAKRNRVSVSDSLSEARRMLDENISRCAAKVRKIEKHLRQSIELRLVLKAIFNLGANGVHRVADLASYIERHEDPTFSYDQFVSAFEQLAGLGLYVQTGKSGEVVFAKDPMFSHILGLICEDPSRYKKDVTIFGLLGQRNLPLFGSEEENHLPELQTPIPPPPALPARSPRRAPRST